MNTKEKLYLVKHAGFWSETIGSIINPLNFYGGAMLGGGAALATDTHSLREQAERDSGGINQVLKDILIPGVGPYNAMKRLGTSIRGSELKDEIARRSPLSRADFDNLIGNTKDRDTADDKKSKRVSLKEKLLAAS